MKVLILGVTGMLGHMACRVLTESHDVYGTCRNSYASTSVIHSLIDRQYCLDNMDVLDTSSLTELLQKVRPQALINAVGVVKQKKNANEPIDSIRANALFPHELARLANDFGIKLIHLSTDCVFSGNQGMYTENSPTDPIDVYGQSKLLGEVTQPPHLTLRTSIIGRQLLEKFGLIEWFLDKKYTIINGYKYAIYSGLTTQALCQVINKILNQHFSLSGLYHIASEPISKYDLLSRLNQIMQLNIKINPDIDFRCDRSLNGERFISDTGISIPSWEEMLSQFASDAPQYETWRRKT